MACECQKNRIVYPFGNDVLMRLFLYEGQPRAEFTVDGYDSWSVRILRDGCITAKGIESGLDENNRIVIHLPNTLPVGIYTMELSIIKNHMERRSMMCGVIEVATCDQYANIPTGVVVGTTQTDMDIYFEITESVWEQGMSSYDYWKIDHPDGTLQEYLDTLLPVQSDWTQTDNTLPDFIKNKPNVFSISSRDIDTMGAVTGLFLITDSSRGGIIISSGLFNYAEQVWIDVEHGYIKTRMMNLGVWGAWSDPIYQPTLVSGTNIKTVNNQSLLGSGNITIQGGGASTWDEIEGKPDFADVATSGSYDDLTDKPTIPAAQVNADWNASSGVAQILNKPTIPDVTGKADKVSSATNGHLAGLNASGNLTDSGIVPSTLVYQGASQGTVPSVDFDPETDTVHVTAQTLSDQQKQQARTNIGAAGVNDVVGWPLINHGTSDTGTAQSPYSISASSLHVWGEVSALHLTLATGEVGYCQEYNIQFTSGSTATDLDLPSTIQWINNVEPENVQANYLYQVSILNGVGIIAGVDLSSSSSS